MLYADLQGQTLIPIIPMNRHGGEALESRASWGRLARFYGVYHDAGGVSRRHPHSKVPLPPCDRPRELSDGHGVVFVILLGLCGENPDNREPAGSGTDCSRDSKMEDTL